jgi:hypothetical protein
MPAPDGYTPHPDMTPTLTRILNEIAEDLAICCRDHPEDERLDEVEANVRWLLGRRV